MPAVFGEPCGISMEFTENKIAAIIDGTFKKNVRITEDFTSVRRIRSSNESFTATSIDMHDPLLSSSNMFVHVTTGIQRKVFSQNLEVGVRKIEIIQGLEMGQAVIRFSYNIERGLAWRIHTPFEKQLDSENTLQLPQSIELIIQTDLQIKYEEDILSFNLPDGFSQIVFFIRSQIPYDTIGKNLLLITLGDNSKQDIIAMAENEKFYPIITFVYLQDFKNKVTRYTDLYQIGTILALRQHYGEAINYLKKAVDAVRATGDQKMEAEILMSLATVESDSGDFKQAINDFSYASKIIEELQLDSLRLGCLLSLSKNLKKLRNFKDAMNYQSAILEECRSNHDQLGEAEIMVDISESLLGLGRIDDSIEYQQAAINLRRQMHDQIGEANNLTGFGELLISAGKMSEAMGAFEQSLRIKKNLNDERGVAECLKNIGLAFFNRGKYEKAKEYYMKAKESFQNLALALEAQRIDQLLLKMKERPYPQCEVCKHRCTPDIIGMTQSVANDTSFSETFKQVLRGSLAMKKMDKMVDLLLETASQNPDLSSKGIPAESYAFCLMITATNLHLTQLNDEQKRQILNMVQDSLRLRKYL
jgi:tetratricopeptide (TPR) repeat protein